MLKRFLPFLLLASIVFVAFIPSMTKAGDDDEVEGFKQEWNDVLNDYNKVKNNGEKEERKENEVKPKDKKQGGVTLLSKRYPSSHYHPIVTDDSGFWPFSSEEIAKHINSVSTGFFALNKQLSEIVDAALNKFLSLDVIDKVRDTVTEASDKLWEVMKDHFAGILIVIAIVQIFVYYVAESNGMKAGRTMFKLLMILIVAFVWVSSSGYYLKLLNHWSDQAQGYIMSAGTVFTDDVGDIEEGEEVEGSAALLRNNFFQMTVRRPYLIMNYGTTDENKIEKDAKEGENRIDDILALKTDEDGNEDRADLAEDEVEEHDNDYMDQSSVWSKFALSILSIGFTLFLGAPLFMLVFFNVLVQFIVLMIAFILPITFIVSILPSFANSGWHSLGRLLSTFIMKMFISILILFVFMTFSIVDVLIPPTNVGSYFLNMTLAAILIVFMLMKRDKIVEFITAGRVVGMSGQTGAGMAGGARYATNMARTGGSHVVTKGLTATAGGMALAQSAKQGLGKARENFRNARNETKEKRDGDQQNGSSNGADSGNVVNLNERRNRRNNRSPQGGDGNTQGNEKGQGSSEGSNKDTNEQEMHTPNTDGDTSDRGESRNTGEDTNGQNEGEATSDESGKITPMATPRGDTSKRGESRNTGENIDSQSNDESHSGQDNVVPYSNLSSDRSHSRTHPYDKKQRDQNPQTSGEVTPPKKVTQWESGKQLERQRENGTPHPGRKSQPSQGEGMNRRNRSPRNDDSSRPSDKPIPSSKPNQQDVPLHKQQKEERKQQRKEKRRVRKETNHTAVNKMKNAAKQKRREMVDKRKRRGRR